ncbi:hypothetical protein BGZ80_007045 [Entomortierella chlamydospora]|uniref:Ubiquitin-like domain-containing protein n=1 Tax=Entomortierella chlamydospora TaxID=101097 RepID=A0A9P6MZW4_9FUNG|nr:hypothetical protein BGZ79_008621 [Entomortierella chlamydospora]KAG0018537.1 hypothetical protein BGZ80_007045 [Entomortierella chlamydospora]
MQSDDKTAFALFSTIISTAAAPFVFVNGVAAAGFGSAGIAAGSPAAAFMSSYGGAVSSGSLCATLQSIGAAGLGLPGIFLAASVRAAIGAGLSFILLANSPILVVIVNKEGQALELKIRPRDSIAEVKSKIRDLSGISPSLQILQFSGITLEDNKKVHNYNIKDGSVIFLITKIEVAMMLVAKIAPL